MPITRRRRANPPDQPENNNTVTDQQQENGAEQVQPQLMEEAVSTQPVEATLPEPPSIEVAQTEGTSQSTVRNAENMSLYNSPSISASPASSVPMRVPPTPQFPTLQMASMPHPAQYQNGERFERVERQEYPQVIEGGRRTARGELFRRPPQQPLVQPAPVPVPQLLQAPTHEITLPMGNLLHLAYNPSYTGSDEARSALLHTLMQESKTGGRARCWSCGALAIVYDRWNTRSKTFGEIGIAYCEICGVWSVM
jgi:hypothetical protein